ncbi:hypothetical protein DFP72DRAFT_844852 [Ephemerocybe angulata]|uniref:Uncharacterized protein n=1 Tax=Ephemerocybe angulata TaxID=980116 RepID=A0A8H6MA31_9AGAR|nr:hypothetical protein DFP72DRAFT_844852 [Tulosesus angulatus]
MSISQPLLILDDRDPSIIYKGDWTPGGVPLKYGGTTTYSLRPNSTALVPFYDDGVTLSPTTVHLVQPQATTYHVNIFQSKLLPVRRYKLTISHDTPENGFLCLDAFYIGGHDMYPSSSASGGARVIVATPEPQKMSHASPHRLSKECPSHEPLSTRPLSDSSYSGPPLPGLVTPRAKQYVGLWKVTFG